MTEQHPITLTEELVEQWWNTMPGSSRGCLTKLATQAAQWGWDQRGAATESELQQRADQELEACCEWLIKSPYGASLAVNGVIEQLRAARRPEPLSETDQALTDLEQLLDAAKSSGVFNPPDNIRQCLERLKKLEEATND